jgi:uncharacterized membrane protein
MLRLASGLAALAVLLSACGASDSELDGDLEVNGMDPVFWGVQVKRADNMTTITVTGSRDVTGDLPVKSKGEKDAVLLTAKTSAGDFVMTVSRGDCRDGLGEREYHWSVLVDWQGETLKGCAAPAAPAAPPAG